MEKNIRGFLDQRNSTLIKIDNQVLNAASHWKRRI